jgi:hypothetical protein
MSKVINDVFNLIEEIELADVEKLSRSALDKLISAGHTVSDYAEKGGKAISNTYNKIAGSTILGDPEKIAALNKEYQKETLAGKASGLYDSAANSVKTTAGEASKKAGELYDSAVNSVKTTAGEASKKAGELYDSAVNSVGNVYNKGVKSATDTWNELTNNAVADKAADKIADKVSHVDSSILGPLGIGASVLGIGALGYGGKKLYDHLKNQKKR